MFIVSNDGLNEDEFTLEMIDAGAEEVDLEDGLYEIVGPMDAFGIIQEKLQSLGITPEEACLERVPTSYKSVDSEVNEQIEKLIGLLEEDDDVVSVYHNLAT